MTNRFINSGILLILNISRHYSLIFFKSSKKLDGIQQWDTIKWEQKQKITKNTRYNKKKKRNTTRRDTKRMLRAQIKLYGEFLKDFRHEHAFKFIHPESTKC